MENKCPICKRYVGLWTRDGKLIACELHDHKLTTEDKWETVEVGNRLLFVKQ